MLYTPIHVGILFFCCFLAGLKMIDVGEGQFRDRFSQARAQRTLQGSSYEYMQEYLGSLDFTPCRERAAVPLAHSNLSCIIHRDLGAAHFTSTPDIEQNCFNILYNSMVHGERKKMGCWLTTRWRGEAVENSTKILFPLRTHQ